MKNIFSFLFIMLFFVSDIFGCAKTDENFKLGKNIQDDATSRVLSCINNIHDGEKALITFEKGVYNFYPTHAMEKFCYISNHDDLLSRIAFPLNGKKNITIDGNGSRFIFHGRLIPFLIEDCKNVTVKNLSIDFAEPFFSQGVVVGKNEKEKYFDLKISQDFPYEIRNDEIYFLKPYYFHGLGQAILYDPKTMGIAYNTNKYTPLTLKHRIFNQYGNLNYKYEKEENDDYICDYGWEYSMKVKELKPGLVRIFGNRKSQPEVGMVLACKGNQSRNRIVPGFKVNNVVGCMLDNVTVNHSGGMAFLFENCENVDLYKCKVIPSQGRMVSAAADASHFVGCRGQVSIRDCIFKNQLDDAANIHGTYQRIMNKIDDYSLGLRMGHFQQLGFTLARKGDTIGFVRLKDSFHAYDKRTVKSIKFVNGRYQIITFKEKLPSRVKVGDLVENISAYPSLLVENSTFACNRARGILISTPRKTVIRNNYFNTEMSALLLPVESSSWYESGCAANVTIKGNVFQDCSISGSNAPVISFVTDDKNNNVAFNNIKIIDNIFNQYSNYILGISNVDGLSFSKNTITNSHTYPKLYPDNPAFKISSSKNIVFKDNKYKGDAKRIIDCSKNKIPVKFN